MACVRVLVPFLDEVDNRTRGIGSAFSCTDERAAQLVAAGLAKPCGAEAVPRRGTGAPSPSPVPGRPAAPEAHGAPGPPAAGGQMTRAQLVARAEALGVAVPSKANKNKIAALIAEACGGGE